MPQKIILNNNKILNAQKEAKINPGPPNKFSGLLPSFKKPIMKKPSPKPK